MSNENPFIEAMKEAGWQPHRNRRGEIIIWTHQKSNHDWPHWEAKAYYNAGDPPGYPPPVRK